MSKINNLVLAVFTNDTQAVTNAAFDALHADLVHAVKHHDGVALNTMASIMRTLQEKHAKNVKDQATGLSTLQFKSTKQGRTASVYYTAFDSLLKSFAAFQSNECKATSGGKYKAMQAEQIKSLELQASDIFNAFKSLLTQGLSLLDEAIKAENDSKKAAKEAAAIDTDKANDTANGEAKEITQVTYTLPDNLEFLTDNNGVINAFVLDSHQVTLQELSTILNTMKGNKSRNKKAA